MQLNRIQRRLTAIAEDDALLKQEQLGRNLTYRDLQDALEERGM